MEEYWVQYFVKGTTELPVIPKKQDRKDPFTYYETVGAKEYAEMEKQPEVYEAIMSSTALDRHGDVMLPRGCDFEHYLENPTLQLYHDHTFLPVGKILMLGVSDDTIKAFFIFDEGDDIALEVKGKYDRKFMRAFSIGFKPKSYETFELDKEGNMPSEVEIPLPDGTDFKLDMSKYSEMPRVFYNHWELLENSCVNVGSNPDALKKHFISGAKLIKERIIEKAGDLKDLVEPDIDENIDKLAELIESFMQKYGEDFVFDGVVGSHSTSVDAESSWSAATAKGQLAKYASSDGSGDKDKIAWSKFAKGFAWFDSKKTETTGAYKLPHHYVKDSKLVAVWKGVTSAMAALLGARGGVKIPEDDRKGVYNHLAKHYRDADKEPPELKEYTEDEIKLIAEDKWTPVEEPDKEPESEVGFKLLEKAVESIKDNFKDLVTKCDFASLYQVIDESNLAISVLKAEFEAISGAMELLVEQKMKAEEADETPPEEKVKISKDVANSLGTSFAKLEKYTEKLSGDNHNE